MLKVFRSLNRNLCFSSIRLISENYKRLVEGNGLARKVYLTHMGKKISPWHDVLPWTNTPDEFLMVNEIPRLWKEKQEVIANEAYNPIMQDFVLDKINKAKRPRFLGLEPIFNYGMLPQTWEDSTVVNPKTKLFGDDDPLDICELGKRPMQVGSVCKVRVLGAFCVADQGEMDWKLLALNSEEAERLKVKDLKTYKEKFPGRVEEIMNWFVCYKKYEGKKENTILFGAKVMDVDEALGVIKEAHESYKSLVMGRIKRKDPFWHTNELLK